MSSRDVTILVPCPRCGTTSPVDMMSCPACGAELGGETVLDALDNVHGLQTVLFGARGASAATSQTETAPDGQAFPSEPPTKAVASTTSEPPIDEPTDDEPTDDEPTDDEIGLVTAEVPPKPSAAAPAPAGGSSSDPPTRFVRRFEQHIDLPSGSVVGDFEVDGKIGEGAMGVVYSARHVQLGRRLALKVIAPAMGSDPQALARFEREARALASLHHPNVVDVYAFGTLPDGRSYFAMEHLVGETLDERLERGRVPFDEALDVLDQMARALEAAHAQGIVHRDLKPSNTFLVRIPREPRAVVKLVDFGLAKSAVADGTERTASDAVIGTAAYISPEQCRGPNVDGRTDIYAFGCVAYELILGRHPFPDARTNVAAIAAHLTERPPQPRAIWPGIPAALDLLLFSMVAKDPNYRPTLTQVRSVVASVRSAVTGRATRAATMSARRGALRARVWTVALVAFALFVGAVIGTRVLGGRASRGAASPTAPAGEATNLGSAQHVPIVVLPKPKSTMVVTPVPAIGAGRASAPAVNSTKSTTPRRPTAATTTDAAKPDKNARPALVDVGSALNVDSSSEREAPAQPEVAKPQVSPTVVDKPAVRAAPPRPPKRDDTINPFGKRGSAAR